MEHLHGRSTLDPLTWLKSLITSVGNMRDVRNNANTSSKAKKVTLTYKEAVLKQNAVVGEIANRGKEIDFEQTRTTRYVHYIETILFLLVQQDKVNYRTKVRRPILSYLVQG